MATVRLQSGYFTPEASVETTDYLEKEAMLVYAGHFISAEGPVDVSEKDIARIEENHNLRMAKAVQECGNIEAQHCPPIQLDHSVSSRDTIGRLWGKVRVGTALVDGNKVTALFGRVRVLGAENAVKVKDGRWVHGSLGADFEAGKINEFTVTPFPAAESARMLSRVNFSELASYKGWDYSIETKGKAPFPLYYGVVEGSIVTKPCQTATEAGKAARDFIDTDPGKLSKLSKGEPMDKERLKKHLTEQKKLSDQDANLRLGAMNDDEMSKLSAEVEEHDKNLAAEAEKKDAECKRLAAEAEEKQKADEKLAADKEEADKAKLSEKEKCSWCDGKGCEECEDVHADPKKKLSEEDDKDKKDDEKKDKKELSAQKTKLATAKTAFTKLAKGLVKTFSDANLTARKANIGIRLSKLRQEAKLTPAEQKNIDITKLAAKSDDAVEAFFEAFNQREQIIPMGQHGSTRAESTIKLAAQLVKDKSLGERLSNMPFTSKAIKGTKEGKSGTRLSTDKVEIENKVENQEVELTAELNPETASHLAALAESNKKLHNQLEEIVKLVGPVLGINLEDLN